ncbi:serine/threonine-protein kinase [Pseudaquabacterium terrae]|uniref:serine/threonine-protein kinase n=1 Tax=Pseudaquabacterium terrae TaxID=2732868 RepID=UPI001FEA4469|nr:serine/threonine-protein kinase [Aquabacterium terrae]
MSSTPEATSPPADHPAWIGRYRVQSRLGEGATSEVFLARDDFRDRLVAVKRVRAATGGESADNHYRAHFFDAEAALAGKLKHPNVVEIFDAVPDPVMPYLVMEYVGGVTLRRFCRSNALLSLDQIVEIGFKCAMALGYVARQGLIHRDVKPANILAVMQGEHVIDVKISDFGSVLDTMSERTQVFRVGSLAYMSPEQLDGSALDSRADQYSLAGVLYHLVAGRPPFDAVTQPALMHQIYNGEAPPLTLLREDVPPRMQAILERALSKSREDRYADWDEFARDWSSLVANAEVPRGQLQDVLHSERFNLLRSLEFFADFGDVEIWEVVHRGRWQRHAFGAALYRKGEEGRTFHIITQGRIDVYRDGNRVAQLGAGTSVGEMAYLAPNPDLRTHAADVIVSEQATTLAFTPETMQSLSQATRHLFDGAFIRVLVRRLHAAHESLAHPRRIL